MKIVKVGFNTVNGGYYEVYVLVPQVSEEIIIKAIENEVDLPIDYIDYYEVVANEYYNLTTGKMLIQYMEDWS